MNLTAIYIVFGIIFGLIILAAIGMGTAHIVVMQKRTEVAKQAKKQPRVVITSEDLTLRIRGGAVEAYDTLPADEPAAEPANEPAAETEEPEETRDGVFLARGEKLTYAEKIARLSPETQALMEAFCSYVERQEGCSRLQQAGAVALRYNKAQIAKILVRRDTVILNFAIVNPDLGRMAKEEKGSLKLRPVEIRLTDADALEVAKQTADLTIGYLKAEEEYKLEKRREARREAAKKKREIALSE